MAITFPSIDNWMENVPLAPSIFSAISGVKAPKKLKGGDAPFGEFLETVVRNSRAAIEAGMRNVAANRGSHQLPAFKQPNGWRKTCRKNHRKRAGYA